MAGITTITIRSALAVAGVTTVGGLADLNARELTERLGGLGFGPLEGQRQRNPCRRAPFGGWGIEGRQAA